MGDRVLKDFEVGFGWFSGREGRKANRVGKQSEKEGVATTIAMRVGNLVSFLRAADFCNLLTRII